MDRELSKKISFKSPKGANPHEVHADLIKLNDEELQQLKDDENTDAIENLLDQIHEKIRQCTYSVNRKKYYGYLTVYFNNRAYFHHQSNDLEAAQLAYDQCIQNYECLKGFLSTREENIHYTLELVRMYLRFCALLSQNGVHAEAFRYAEKAIENLIECVRILRVLCEQEMRAPRTEHCPSNKDSLYSVDRVNFRKLVLEGAKSILDELVQLSPPHKLIFEQRGHYDRIMNHIYSWKDNDGVAEKLFKKQLQLHEKEKKRNLLGLPKSTKGVEDFQMGNLMLLNFKKVGSVFETPKNSILTAEKVKELGLIASMCYFTSGTERRFHEIDEDMDELNIVVKYEKLSKNEEIQKCKIMHIKAIEIAGKIAPEAKNYFQHLINSFNKNYKAVLDQIKEESMISPSFIGLGCDEASTEYGIDTGKTTKNKRRMTTSEKQVCKQKISKLLHKYGMNEDEQ